MKEVYCIQRRERFIINLDFSCVDNILKDHHFNARRFQFYKWLFHHENLSGRLRNGPLAFYQNANFSLSKIKAMLSYHMKQQLFFSKRARYRIMQCDWFFARGPDFPISAHAGHINTLRLFVLDLSIFFDTESVYVQKLSFLKK